MSKSPVHRLVLFIAALVMLLVASPIIFAATGELGGLAALSRVAFSNVCHQDPGRSFFVHGLPLPVCARCTGLYLGFFLAWLAYTIRGRRLAPAGNTLLIAGMTPMVLDGAFNAAGLFTSPGWLRFMTGALFAAAAARGLWAALYEIHERPASVTAGSSQRV